MPESLAPEILTFHSDATEYCRLIDGLCAGTLPSPYNSLLGCMSRLVKSAYELPWTTGGNESVVECMNHDAWRALADKITESIAPAVNDIIEFYRDLNDERGIDRSMMLFDDLADVYRDMKRGFDYWDIGAIDQAVWLWRLHYEGHWGEHLFDGILTVFEIHFRLGFE